MIKKYIKKPVTIEAIIWDGANETEIMEFVGAHCCVTTQHTINGTVTNLIINTLEGDHYASVGDYIVKGIKVILLSECLYSDVMKYVKREDVFVSQPSITMSVFLWYYWRLCSIICLVFLQQRVVFLVS